MALDEKNAESLKEPLCVFGVIVVAALLFGSVFARENSLSYSIGYNLTGAERVLAGEVPYRDFHTLYPPAIVYLNAILFRFFGVSLITALAGVLFFKVLTTATLYLCARSFVDRLPAFVIAAFSLVWLRPNGPFKSVPMQY